VFTADSRGEAPEKTPVKEEEKKKKNYILWRI
jgi:hypothetical protein